MRIGYAEILFEVMLKDRDHMRDTACAFVIIDVLIAPFVKFSPVAGFPFLVRWSVAN